MKQLKPWTITQLYAAMQQDRVNYGGTASERGMAEAICIGEIRDLARKIQAERKLTPGEQSILENLRIRL